MHLSDVEDYCGFAPGDDAGRGGAGGGLAAGRIRGIDVRAAGVQQRDRRHALGPAALLLQPPQQAGGLFACVLPDKCDLEPIPEG